jgi:hypothetical protein
VGNTVGKRLLVLPRRRFAGNTEILCNEKGEGKRGWMEIAQDSDAKSS